MTAPGNLICSKCGFSNVPGDQFCGSCGAFLEWEGVAAADPAPAPPGPLADVPVVGPPVGLPPVTAAPPPATTAARGRADPLPGMWHREPGGTDVLPVVRDQAAGDGRGPGREPRPDRRRRRRAVPAGRRQGPDTGCGTGGIVGRWRAAEVARGGRRHRRARGRRGRRRDHAAARERLVRRQHEPLAGRRPVHLGVGRAGGLRRVVGVARVVLGAGRLGPAGAHRRHGVVGRRRPVQVPAREGDRQRPEHLLAGGQHVGEGRVDRGHVRPLAGHRR